MKVFRALKAALDAVAEVKDLGAVQLDRLPVEEIVGGTMGREWRGWRVAGEGADEALKTLLGKLAVGALSFVFLVLFLWV